MAYVYEINGQKVEFETEPTAADIDEAARSMGTEASPRQSIEYAAPQLARAVVPGAVDMAQNVSAVNAAKGVTANIRDAGTIASILSKNVTPEVMNEFMQSPIKNTAKLAGAYAAGHPYTQAIGNVVSGMRNIPGALVSGAVAPESAVMMPYQMAAYEQDKIRQNPNAPGLESNPYAQVQRGEYATQGQAGAANQRRAVMNMPYGNVTPGEKILLDQDKQQRMRMMMQYEAAKRVLGTQQ